MPDSVYPENSVLLAPLAGYTDLPFRRACRKWGCRYAFTPLVEVGSIIHRNPRADQILERGRDEAWLGVQILGANPAAIAEAVHQIEDRQFDVVDFNMGCPVPKITRRGAGAAMCGTPELATDCLQAILENTRKPVTAKIRILDGERPESTLKLARMLADTGIRALTVHGRTWAQRYSGSVAVDIIRVLQEELEIPVIANGGVMNAEDAMRLREASGCSRIMVARGAIGNPWLFAEICGKRNAPPGHDEICEMLAEHVRGMLAYSGEDTGIRNARKIILAYLVGRGYARPHRAAVTTLCSADAFETFLAQIRHEGPTDGFLRSRG